MKDFKRFLLKTIDDACNQTSSLINDFNDTISSIDLDPYFDLFNKKKEAVLAKGNEFLSSFNDFVDTVKNSTDGLYLTLPFDADSGDTFTASCKDGLLTVKVVNEDEEGNYSKHSSTTTIPKDCDATKMDTFKDKKLKTITVFIPKKADTVQNKKAENKVKKIKKPRPTDMNYKHQKRDAKGRFIKS